MNTPFSESHKEHITLFIHLGNLSYSKVLSVLGQFSLEKGIENVFIGWL